MLKTNSKQARENVREYIINHFNPDSYDFRGDSSDFGTVALYIIARFERDKFLERGTRAELFADWCAGLPSVLDTCYYYNRSAVDDLGAILEETDAEKSRYTEQQAEKMLTRLIYAELCKACNDIYAEICKA